MKDQTKIKKVLDAMKKLDQKDAYIRGWVTALKWVLKDEF